MELLGYCGLVVLYAGAWKKQERDLEGSRSLPHVHYDTQFMQ